MKKDIEKLIELYKNERWTLEVAISQSQSMLSELKAERQTRANSLLVNGFVPDLSRGTYLILRALVPTFKVKTVPAWLGLVRKIDPQTNIALLRLQLGQHLDSLEKRDLPETWRMDVVEKYDANIELFQRSIATGTEGIAEIDRRLAELGKLLSDKKRLANEKVQNAVKDELDRGSRESLLYRQRDDDQDDILDALLIDWFLDEVLSFDTAPVAEVISDEAGPLGGGGDSGGGGSTGTWPEGSSEDLAGNVDSHAELGSGSFS